MQSSNYKQSIKPSKTQTYLLAFFILFITLSLVQYPQETFDSAIIGLNLWWNVVFPSLLPFFILSELLMGIGIVHALGVLLEPLMRPLFNVPGIGAFALSMGLASGYPMDAVITCKFRKSNLCSQVEAERLLAFTNTADPLFMFGAVAVGMFAMPEIGIAIALAHYISSFCIGIIYRFYGTDITTYSTVKKNFKGNIFKKAFRALYEARIENNKSFGILLGDSVKASMNTSLLIGGFIILFSVFLHILSAIGITNYLDNIFSLFLNLINFTPQLAPALTNGLFEIDLGTLSASKISAPLHEKIAIVSAIIAWSGLSVHGQIASIVIETGISMKPYIIARFLHATLAAIFSIIFLGPLNYVTNFFILPTSTTFSLIEKNISFFNKFEQTLYFLCLLLFFLLTISLILHLFKSIFSNKNKRA